MRLRVGSLLLFAAACSKRAAPPPPNEVRLATALPAAVIDTVLRLVAQTGGPRAERIAAAAAGAEVLGQAGAPNEGAELRWDSEPYGAIAAAQRGELLPMPVTASDVPALWRDPGGTWAAVGGRAVVLLVATHLLGDHPVPTNYAVLTQPWLKGKVAWRRPQEARRWLPPGARGQPGPARRDLGCQSGGGGGRSGAPRGGDRAAESRAGCLGEGGSPAALACRFRRDVLGGQRRRSLVDDCPRSGD